MVIRNLNKNRMKNILIICFLLMGKTVLGQIDASGRYRLEFADTYVLRVSFKDVLLKARCHCIYKKGENCTLYSIKIKEVLNVAPDTPLDSAGLLGMEYIAVPTLSIAEVKDTNSFVITAKLSASKKYLSFTRVLKDTGEGDINFYHAGAYLSGYLSCKTSRKDPFEAYIDQHRNNIHSQ